jgi:DNA-3-methyladenine glycosylase I
MIQRCDWCQGDELYERYHDEEWGVPCYQDLKLFELMILEGAQAGLSWITVLRKREGYRQAFEQFNPDKIASYDDGKIEQLLTNPSIIRNRLKVKSAINNAQIFLKVIERHHSFSDYLWRFVDGEPIINSFHHIDEVPASTEVSDRMSKALKKDGFSFIGSTICYAYMQASGMVNDHLIGCHCRTS